MSITTVYDSTAINLGTFTVPAGVLLAGYDTGSGGIAWSTEQFAAHPGSLHIDQDPSASDLTADLLDSEFGAVPVGSPELATWYKNSLANFNSGKRPGQRHPSIYQSANNVTANVNALIANGVNSGPGLWVANWNLSDPQAVADVQNAAGPFPIIGVQFHNAGPFDVSVFSSQWLDTVSKAPVPPTPAPPPVTEYGVCPAGGKHNTTDSYNYVLTDEHGTQANWRWCIRCRCLTHA